MSGSSWVPVDAAVELRIVLLGLRNDQELIRPVKTTFVIGSAREDRVFRAAKSTVRSWANESAHVRQTMAGTPEPEGSLAEKQILTCGLSSRINERWQRTTDGNRWTTADLRGRRARI